jgi:hypothetical protein
VTTAVDDLIDHALELLRKPAPVCDGPIEEELDMVQIADDHELAVSVDVVTSSPSDDTTGLLDYSTELVVTCYARDDSRNSGLGRVRASRQLHQLVHQRLREDASWGGRLMYMGPPAMQHANATFDTRMGRTSARYELRHRVNPDTLEA